MSVLVKERPHGAPHPPQPRRLLRSAPLRSPFPSGEGLFRLSLSIRASKTDKIIAFTVTVNLTKRMRAESLPRWGRGTAAEEKREYLERFSDAVAVDEVHHTDALSHIRKCNRGCPENQYRKQPLKHNKKASPKIKACRDSYVTKQLRKRD